MQLGYDLTRYTMSPRKETAQQSTAHPVAFTSSASEYDLNAGAGDGVNRVTGAGTWFILEARGSDVQLVAKAVTGGLSLVFGDAAAATKIRVGESRPWFATPDATLIELAGAGNGSLLVYAITP